MLAECMCLGLERAASVPLACRDIEWASSCEKTRVVPDPNLPTDRGCLWVSGPRTLAETLRIKAAEVFLDRSEALVNLFEALAEPEEALAEPEEALANPEEALADLEETH